MCVCVCVCVNNLPRVVKWPEVERLDRGFDVLTPHFTITPRCLHGLRTTQRYVLVLS